ncbi:fatty-acyl-CoA synthase [Frankia sp. EI5c]|uniref:long-chain fatty acid--CoA ligase n=1 Tax=Frankia sp. EI5c TaxID=683316 RepID=UPI0007C3B288|nr:fatty-acyl-CoA synthase [Frankia sp. EI5c]
MRSTMQDVPLAISQLLDHGSTVHGAQRVFSASPSGITETTFAEIGANAARLAHALAGLGIAPDDRVATFMWNSARHLEAYYGIPSMGCVVHPLNIRLPGDQIAYIANHAGDRAVIADASLLPLLTPLLDQLATVEHLIVDGADEATLAALRERPRPAGRPGLAVHDLDALLAGRPATYDWPELDERDAAAICYTSGTTGEPKGVAYSHRSIYLHALGTSVVDVLRMSAVDRLLCVVPQFHVLAWGVPYGALLTGAELVMPGSRLAPGPLAEVITATRPTKAVGVPTIWAGLLEYVQANGTDISCMTEAVVGGAACPPALFDAYDRLGVTLVHGWGMTETSPMGTVSRPPAGLSAEETRRYRLSQGRLAGPVQARLIGPDGTRLPWDGTSAGELEVRGPWITGGYLGDESGREHAGSFHDGWLRTGDVGTITPDGFLTLTDRSKDVIKSGGEWISSVELENHLMSHPAVLEAAVIGVADERWGERPLACVVVREGVTVDFAALRDYLDGRVARWQRPERWVAIPEVPKTSVGKFDKKRLRAAYANGELKPRLLIG